MNCWELGDEFLRSIGTNFLQPSTTASCKHHDPASHCATGQSLHGLRGSVPELESTVTPPWKMDATCVFPKHQQQGPWFHEQRLHRNHLVPVNGDSMIPSICWKTQAFAFPLGHWEGYIGDPTSWTRSLVLSGSSSLVAGYRVTYCPVLGNRNIDLVCRKTLCC